MSHKFHDTHGHPPTLVLKGDRWGLWVGSRWDVKKEAEGFDLILNLSGDPLYKQYGHHFPPIARELQTFAHGKVEYTESGWEREVMIDWPNYSVPLLPMEFWPQLAKLIQRQKRTLMFCMGGHGRTGTGLALMMLATGAFTRANESIEWIRRNYCKEAIEGAAQVQLIQRFEQWMLGIDIGDIGLDADKGKGMKKEKGGGLGGWIG